jgi:hypothetical protein
MTTSYDKFFSDLTKKEDKPFTIQDFFRDAPFAKFANPAMETAAKNEGWQIPDLKPPQKLGLDDMKTSNPADALKTAKPNMMTQAMGNTQKPVQQKPNNPTGVSSGQGFNPV